MYAPTADGRPVLYSGFGSSGGVLRGMLHVMEAIAGVALAIDVLVVFASVIFRYALHEPLEWAEEVARAIMVLLVFFGAGTVLGRGQHAGVDAVRGLLPGHWRPAMIQMCCWIVVAVALALCATSIGLTLETSDQMTPLGLPQAIYLYPVVVGSLFIAVFGIANALEGPPRLVWGTLVAGLGILAGVYVWNHLLAPGLALRPLWLLIISFVGSIVIGVPIAFALAFASLIYFLNDPSLPLVIYAQQMASGADHFVLLAIPFFVVAGLAMEANGMSARLIELLLRMLGRMKGGLNLISIVATALFSGISGSKLADIAAVSGIVMPAVRKTRQDPNEAAGLLACTAVMSETIPPCVNMIIFAFVANISVSGLFMAGLVPAGVLALCLAAVAIWFGRRIDPSDVSSGRTLRQLVIGSLIAIVMVFMISRGVISGIATSTEISAFAVVYALVVGGLAFRELTARSVATLFVRSASMAGSILFIVAAASNFAFALTVEQIPAALADSLVTFGHSYGSMMFIVLAAMLMVFFGAVLEGAPALIIFGPLLTPIATQLGVNPLHFGTIMVIAMGLGLFAPPVGLGLFATCAMTGTRMEDVARPMAKYLVVLVAGLVLLIVFPSLSLWLPKRLGLS